MTVIEYIDFRIKQSYDLLNISENSHPDLNRIQRCLNNHFIIEMREIIKDTIHDTEQYYMSFA